MGELGIIFPFLQGRVPEGRDGFERAGRDRQCPRCLGRMKLIALIEDPAVIAKILDHLGLSSEIPRARPAKPPAELAAPPAFALSSFGGSSFFKS